MVRVQGRGGSFISFSAFIFQSERRKNKAGEYFNLIKNITNEKFHSTCEPQKEYKAEVLRKK
jgi:hypothetical protein